MASWDDTIFNMGQKDGGGVRLRNAEAASTCLLASYDTRKSYFPVIEKSDMRI